MKTKSGFSVTSLVSLTCLVCLCAMPRLPAQAGMEVWVQEALVAGPEAGLTTIVPAGTHLTEGRAGFGFGVHAVAGGYYYRAAGYLSVQQAAGSPSVWFSTAVEGSNPPLIATGEILVKLDAPQPLAGRLLIDVAPRGSAFGSVRVDVGTDGADEVSLSATSAPLAPLSIELPAGVGPAPLWIVVRNTATSTVGGSLDVTVSFEPRAGAVVPYGDPCGHALSGYLSPSPQPGPHLALRATGVPAGSPAFWVLGTTPLQVVVPPTGCALRSDIVVVLPAATNPWGEAKQQLPIDPGAAGALTAQYVELSAPGVLTSNALAIQVP